MVTCALCRPTDTNIFKETLANLFNAIHCIFHCRCFVTNGLFSIVYKVYIWFCIYWGGDNDFCVVTIKEKLARWHLDCFSDCSDCQSIYLVGIYNGDGFKSCLLPIRFNHCDYLFGGCMVQALLSNVFEIRGTINTTTKSRQG